VSTNTIKNFSLQSLTSIDTSLKIINIFIQIVRMSDGTGGLTDNQVNNWVTRLCNDYSIHKILIREIGRSGLNNTTFYNGMTDDNFPILTSTNTHSNAIDIYLLSPNDTYSRATSIPGIALAVGGGYQGTSVLSHEFGHCLGLYHTHIGRGCNDFASCSENINESNCSTCGDFICDTPADPCLRGNVDTDCNYIGDPSFHPDVHNIMSYAPPTCLNHITAGQTLRIHASILSNSSIFYSRSYKPYISGSTPVCTSGSTYTVNSLPPTGCTVHWRKSSNISLPADTTTNPIVATANGNGAGWIQATIISSCGSVTLPQSAVWVGTPIVNYIMDQNNNHIGVMFCPNVNYGFWPNNNILCAPTSYYWSISPTSGVNGFCNTCLNNWLSFSNYGTYYLSVNETNACGTGSPFTSYVIVTPCGYYRFSLSPNPASDNVKVTKTFVQDTTALAKASLSALSESNNSDAIVYTVKIYNSSGTLFYSTKKFGDEFTIPVNYLKDGTYIIEVTDGKQSYSQQLIIKH
jgi:hypothetical protein